MSNEYVDAEQSHLLDALRTCLEVLASELLGQGISGVAAVAADGRVLASAGATEGPSGVWFPLSGHADHSLRIYVLRAYDDDRLTPRQAQVLALLNANLTAWAIAERLGLSTRTVHHHIERIYERLGVHDRLSALRARVASTLSGRPGPDSDHLCVRLLARTSRARGRRPRPVLDRAPRATSRPRRTTIGPALETAGR